MSEIRVTSVVGENGGDRVGLTTGLTVGPLTGTTGIGATITHQGNASFTGIVTATNVSAASSVTAATFYGNGAGLTGAGKILQVVSETKKDTASTNSTSFVTTGLEKAITITSGNKVLIMIDLYVGVRSGYSVAFQLYNGSSQVTAFQGNNNGGSIRGFAGDFTTPYSYGQVSMSNSFLDSPSGTSQTYKVYFRSGYADTSEYVYLNRPHTNPTHAQSVAACSTITLMEIAA